ncbi:hypothetical protein K435DRAFT_890549, partial [Dendrothele bispora CBS 962.96]
MGLNATLNRKLTEHVAAAVKNDLQKNTYLVDREDFLQRFFPSDDDDAVRRTYNALVSDKSYVNGRWALLPETPDNQESAYYEPFALILNRIHQEYDKCKRADNSNWAKSRRVWLNRHSENPASIIRAASRRPGIANLFIDEAQLDTFSKELESSCFIQIEELEKQRQTKEATESSTSQTSKDDPDPKVSEHAERILAYWLRVAAVVEIRTKKSDMTSQEYQHTLERLAGYFGQMFREQHDRMFVFGLILFHDSLSLWYCDRSGLLGVDRFIDINQEPELFIRVIARLSTMSPTELGWDPTMKVYSSDGQHAYSHSLEIGGVWENFVRSTYLYRTRWVIKINDEKYVTIRALSLSCAEAMWGRGQLVWVAVNKNTRQVVVIKQSWSPFPTIEAPEDEDERMATEERDLTIRSEASVYNHAHSNQDGDMKVGRLIAHEEVANTRTLLDFRRGIRHVPRDSTYQLVPAKRDLEGGLKDEMVHISVVQLEWCQERYVPPKQFTERQLSRIVLKDYGYPLKRFRSLHELVQSIEDCLEGYQYLLQKGVLHRDLSPGNCLICPRSMLAHPDNTQTQPQSLETVGRLIDLDHAKVDYGYKFDEAVAEAQKRVPPTEEQIRWVIDTIEEVYNVVVNAEISKSVCVLPIPMNKTWIIIRAAEYAASIIESLGFREGVMPNSETRQLALEDLGLVHWQTPLPPRFQNRGPENAERSGTIPYMSHVLLNEESTTIPHTAVHDMESMFWVLLYLCLTRKGPGGDLRDELFDQPRPLEKSTRDLLLVVYCFYDSPTQVIQNNKNTLFKNPKDLDPLILHHIHPYFNDVKPILREWWRILCLGFKRYNDAETIEYIHTPRL